MNRQELFDKAVQGIRDQGCLSKTEFGGCYYRHPDNPAVRCAVGHLIPDEIYVPDMDQGSYGSAFDFSFTSRFSQLPASLVAEQDFLLSLQSAHDDSHDVSDFLSKAKTLADRYHLNPTVCY